MTENRKKVKRSAERQITKDDKDEEEKEVDQQTGGEFAKADAATLAKRRIVKAHRPGITTTSSTAATADPPSTTTTSHTKDEKLKSSSIEKEEEEAIKKDRSASAAAANNPFALINFANGGASGTSNTAVKAPALSFASASNINPFAAAAASSFGGGAIGTKNGFGFGSTVTKPLSNSNGSKDHDKVEDEKTEKEEADKSPQQQEDAVKTVLTGVAAASGEEDEDCVLQCRAKVFRSVRKTAVVDDSTKKESTAVPSEGVAATQRDFSTSTTDKNSEKSSETSKSETVSTESNYDSKAKSEKIEMEWCEVGIGPVKLLQKKLEGDKIRTRIVVRRESSPNGPGTKVIFNEVVTKESSVLRPGEKFLSIVCGAPPTNYLFKLKTKDEVDKLEKMLRSTVEACS